MLKRAAFSLALGALGLACSSSNPPATSCATDAQSPDVGASEAGPDDDSVAAESGPPDSAAGPFIKTVFVILMENKSIAQLATNTAAPYISQRLFSISASASQYYNPPRNHPSEPNYIWLEAGDSLGIGDDNDPSFHTLTTPDHLTAYLDKAGIAWKSYQEDIDGSVCPLTQIAQYGPKHDPFVFFSDVTGHNNPADPYCIAHIRPFTEFEPDLARGTVARYNFITPNLCNDMHDCAVQVGDAWLETTLSSITASPVYQDGGAIFVTWDEADGGDGPIGMFVLSPHAKAGYSNAIHYDHSSLVKTVQEIFGVMPLLHHAGDPGVNDLSDLFSTFP
ncbi:MAG: alkaline phosphatase family protein [Myxococcota bacterium]|nr:alkaline phosphatase family protein [Myxococcota bacterium]